MPERFEIYVVYKRRYINTLPFLSFPFVQRSLGDYNRLVTDRQTDGRHRPHCSMYHASIRRAVKLASPHSSLEVTPNTLTRSFLLLPWTLPYINFPSEIWHTQCEDALTCLISVSKVTLLKNYCLDRHIDTHTHTYISGLTAVYGPQSLWSVNNKPAAELLWQELECHRWNSRPPRGRCRCPSHSCIWG